MSEEKIAIKLVIVAIEMVSIGVLLALGNKTNGNNLEFEYEQRIFQNNSYYTDANLEIEEKHRRNTIKTWITAIKAYENEKAFDMLTTDCRSNIYENDVHTFENELVNIINNKNLNEITIELLREEFKNETIYAEYVVSMADLKINLIVEDKGPFTQKIEIKNI